MKRICSKKMVEESLLCSRGLKKTVQIYLGKVCSVGLELLTTFLISSIGLLVSLLSLLGRKFGLESCNVIQWMINTTALTAELIKYLRLKLAYSKIKYVDRKLPLISSNFPSVNVEMNNTIFTSPSDLELQNIWNRRRVWWSVVVHCSQGRPGQ